MESAPSNRMAEARENRQPHIKVIGPHQHGWEFFAMGADGGRYEVCQLCGTRRVVNLPMQTAQHRDWIEGDAEWDPEADSGVQRSKASHKSAAKSEDDGDDDGKAKPAAKGE